MLVVVEVPGMRLEQVERRPFREPHSLGPTQVLQEVVVEEHRRQEVRLEQVRVLEVQLPVVSWQVGLVRVMEVVEEVDTMVVEVVQPSTEMVQAVEEVLRIQRFLDLH